jgi:type VI secretion system ImpM family protein
MFNLFKKKTPLLTQDPITCFGKLPCHHEFIKPKISSSKMISLDNWYQQSYSELNQAFGLTGKDLLKHMPTYHFLFSDLKPMVGSVCASCDASGRPYPFIIIRILENPLAQEFITTVPLFYENYFHGIEQFFQTIGSYKNSDDVDQNLSYLANISCDSKKRIALEKVLTTLKNTSLDDYWQHIDAHTIKIDINTFFSQLVQTFKQPLPLGVRLPLPNKINPLPFVTFYLQLIEIFLPLTMLNWQAYWQQANDIQNAQMLFTSQPLPHQDWQYLLTHPSAQNISDPLSTVIKSDARIISSQPNLSLYDAIQIFARSKDKT